MVKKKVKRIMNLIELFLVISSLGFTGFYIVFMIFFLNKIIPNPSLFENLFFGVITIITAFAILIIFSYNLNKILIKLWK